MQSKFVRVLALSLAILAFVSYTTSASNSLGVSLFERDFSVRSVTPHTSTSGKTDLFVQNLGYHTAVTYTLFSNGKAVQSGTLSPRTATRVLVLDQAASAHTVELKCAASWGCRADAVLTAVD